LVHNAHRIELRGESMRKSRSKKSESASPPTAWLFCSADAKAGAQTPPLPLHFIPASYQNNRAADDGPLKSSPRPTSAALRFLHLTIAITSSTINSSASLRSDPLIGFRRIADRLPSGTLIDFPRIRIYVVFLLELMELLSKSICLKIELVPDNKSASWAVCFEKLWKPLLKIECLRAA
jgi:hypothetical protein